VRPGNSAGSHRSHDTVSIGCLPNPARNLLLPRCSSQRWRKHRTRQCGALFHRLRRHEPDRWDAVPDPTDKSDHRAAGRKGVDGDDTGIRIKLVQPGIRFGQCSNHLVAQRRSHPCLLLRPTLGKSSQDALEATANPASAASQQSRRASDDSARCEGRLRNEAIHGLF
jgi:hypothetical protein